MPADEGLQLLAAKFRVIVPVPVFLMYAVRFLELPAAIVPQFSDVMLTVHALSEKTPTLGDVVIVPEEETFWLTFIAGNAAGITAKVRASATATAIKATIASFDFLRIII